MTSRMVTLWLVSVLIRTGALTQTVSAQLPSALDATTQSVLHPLVLRVNPIRAVSGIGFPYDTGVLTSKFDLGSAGVLRERAPHGALLRTRKLRRRGFAGPCLAKSRFVRSDCQPAARVRARHGGH